jgi:hypothetical protein
VERNLQSDKKMELLANEPAIQNTGEIGGIPMSDSMLVTSRKRELNGDV